MMLFSFINYGFAHSSSCSHCSGLDLLNIFILIRKSRYLSILTNLHHLSSRLINRSLSFCHTDSNWQLKFGSSLLSSQNDFQMSRLSNIQKVLWVYTPSNIFFILIIDTLTSTCFFSPFASIYLFNSLWKFN